MIEKGHILIVDDDKDLCRALKELIEEHGYHGAFVHSGDEAAAHLKRQETQVILLDIRLGRESGLDLLQKLKSLQTEISIILMTAYGTIENAVEAMRQGADNYLTKPIDSTRLFVFIDKAVEAYRLRRMFQNFARLRPPDPMIIAESKEMQQTLHLARLVAPHDTNVFLGGETGTGKSLVAQYIHNVSKHKSSPFVEINCAAIPGELTESELFGHEKGAFSGADRRKIGLLEAAGKGTVFLDELNSLDLAIQPKLLKVLEERKFRRVGGLAELRFEARLITATNQDLAKSVNNGTFREDLLFRLNTFDITVAPLRSRQADILPLAYFFLQKFRGRALEPGRISSQVRELLLAYAWPGNVRELSNVMERANILCPTGTPILPAHLPFGKGNLPSAPNEVETVTPGLSSLVEGAMANTSGQLPSLTDAVDALERELLEKAMKQRRLDTVIVARDLGISRATLYRKLKKYKISAG